MNKSIKSKIELTDKINFTDGGWSKDMQINFDDPEDVAFDDI